MPKDSDFLIELKKRHENPVASLRFWAESIEKAITDIMDGPLDNKLDREEVLKIMMPMATLMGVKIGLQGLANKLEQKGVVDMKERL